MVELIRTRRTTPHVFYTFDALELKNKKKKKTEKKPFWLVIKL